MVKLRGHHLICLHFFKGEGYSDEFVENLFNVLANAEANGVEIVKGGDDVCKVCPKGVPPNLAIGKARAKLAEGGN